LLLNDSGTGLHLLDKHWLSVASRTQRLIHPIVKQFSTATITIENGISQEYISLFLAIHFFPKTSEVLLSLSDNIFFVAEKGYMGIGPSSIREGHKIIGIPDAGLPLPPVLRPRGERHTLVSPAYVYESYGVLVLGN
jgi:hypothetical protein